VAVIGIDYTAAYEQGGGIGRYVRELVSALSMVDDEGAYRLFVAGVSPSRPLPSLARNFLVRSTLLSPAWLARLWYRAWLPLPVEFFLGRVSLYHATDFVLPPVLPGVLSLLTVHDLSFVRVAGAASPSLKRFLDVVVPRSVRGAVCVLADSESTRVDLAELYGVSLAKVVVLLSGVELRFFQRVAFGMIMTTRSKYNIPNTPYILSVGTVQPRKNYGRLVEAVKQLRSRGVDIDLVVAGGKGWLEDEIYEAVKNSGIEQHIHFIGFVDEADLPALYQGAVCLAFPSLYEGFGIPVLEGMASGIPVVTSNVSSLPEVAGDAAILVNPYDVEELTHALWQVIHDENLRTELIRKGLERARQFTWERSARQLLQIYRDLLNE
jgi:glycosyltransferase involved in cell wall biosynthesis